MCRVACIDMQTKLIKLKGDSKLVFATHLLHFAKNPKSPGGMICYW
jgi:hypothetical protein